MILEPTGSLDEGQRLVLLEQVKQWVRDTYTEIRLTPVIDLNDELTTPGYTPTERQKHYDHDAEAEGRPQPGPTTTSNLGCLCRGHHRLKTHSPGG